MTAFIQYHFSNEGRVFPGPSIDNDDTMDMRGFCHFGFLLKKQAVWSVHMRLSGHLSGCSSSEWKLNGLEGDRTRAFQVEGEVKLGERVV